MPEPGWITRKRALPPLFVSSSKELGEVKKASYAQIQSMCEMFLIDLLVYSLIKRWITRKRALPPLFVSSSKELGEVKKASYAQIQSNSIHVWNVPNWFIGLLIDLLIDHLYVLLWDVVSWF